MVLPISVSRSGKKKKLLWDVLDSFLHALATKIEYRKSQGGATLQLNAIPDVVMH
jgi:hypothetical protein